LSNFILFLFIFNLKKKEAEGGGRYVDLKSKTQSSFTGLALQIPNLPTSTVQDHG
jgi:hypothetical protein